MKRFLLTAPNRFTGTAEIWYNDANILCLIDIRQTNMNTETVRGFIRACSPSTDGRMVGNFSSDVDVIEADIIITFEMFWNKYDEKFNKKRCIALWEKIPKADQVKAYVGIDPYNKHLRKTGRFKVNPDTYLKNQLWENEYK